MQHRAGAWKMTSISVWDVQLWKRLEHLPPPHHVDSGTLADKDNFITIMQSPDSKRAKLLYTMFLKHTS